MTKSGLCSFQNGLRSVTCLYKGIRAIMMTAASAASGRGSNNGPRKNITRINNMQEKTLDIWVFPPTVSWTNRKKNEFF